MESGDVSIKGGLFLFGFIHSWDPNFKGDLSRFLGIYKEIFPDIKKYEHENVIDIDLNDEVMESLSKIFDRIANCTRENRFESTDASKILQTIIPDLFVMWDRKIRYAIMGGSNIKSGRDYAYKFLPLMQERAKEYLDSYVSDNGGDNKSASREISEMADGYTLAKLIDEYNFVRHTLRKSLSKIRNTKI